MIVITGGAGFLGSSLAHALNAAGITGIVLADDFAQQDGADQRWQNINGAKFAELIPTARLFTWLNANRDRVDAVIHLGGLQGNAAANTDELLQAHYQYAQMLWDWCTLAARPFLYASSAATYGMGEHGYNDTLDLTYLEKLRPVSPYGFAKHQFDKWVAGVVARSEARPPQVVGMKFFNVFGPHEYFEPGGSLVPKIYESAHANQPCALYGDGQAQRDFIYIDDAIAVLMWFLANPKISGLFNVGTGRASTYFELANAVYKAVYQSPLVTFVPMPAHFPLRAVADISRLRAAGYKAAFTPLESAVQSYVTQFLAVNRLYR
jgi:ADP-L-glycero-D-manno-heptose 6-epimerase